MKKSKQVTVASYSFPYEAQIAKSRLEVEGIPAFITDEYTINMQWLYSNALGGVKVRVPASLEDKAKEVLAYDYSELLDEEFGVDKVVCGQCGSSDVEPYTKGKRPAFVLFLLLGFPLFFYKKGFRCASCGAFTKSPKHVD